ncbi:MAG: hypothetical protein PHD97_03470 [Bacteroidales bacterium]|nr:hypothetical protein [Bacteroidales bacterium]
MKAKYFFIIFLMSVFVFSSFRLRNSGDAEGRNRNVCKKLQGNVLLYFIWTESRQSYLWSPFDINSTLDSVNVSTKWMEEQAAKNGINLKFTVDYFKGDTTNTVYQNFNGSLKKVLQKTEGVEEVNKWTDRIVKTATTLKNRERLIAKLRDQYNTESVVLIFMVNNYFKTDFSYSLNTLSDNDVEYAIISSKHPVIFAQEIMHLFGAPYLHFHPSTSDKANRKKLSELFPLDIMSSPERNLSMLNIGEITKYYVGWTEDINKEYDKLIKNSRAKF